MLIKLTESTDWISSTTVCVLSNTETEWINLFAFVCVFIFFQHYHLINPLTYHLVEIHTNFATVNK